MKIIAKRSIFVKKIPSKMLSKVLNMVTATVLVRFSRSLLQPYLTVDFHN